MPSWISRRCSGGSPRPACAHPPWALIASACGGLFACTLLAPSDEELLGSARGTGGSTAAGAGGAAAGRGGSAGTGASGPDGVVFPILPAGGTGSITPVLPDPPTPEPDAGPPEPPPCVDCEAIRITGGVETARLGTPGGGLNVDICPNDQVVVGMDYTFAFATTPPDFGYITAVAVACGELVPNRLSGSTRVVVGEPLIARGAGAGMTGLGGRCPLGQVVTGFEGARNFVSSTTEIREITLHCAPLALTENSAVSVGAALPTQAMSANFAASTFLAEEILPLTSCPPGQVARGAAIRAGAWVDGISFVCGTPVLALPEGRACTSAIECRSGSCNGTCQPRPCNSPEGCTCGLLESTQYAFCDSAQTRGDADSLCSAAGMHLAYAQDPIAHGWLRASAGEEGIVDAFWLGADDLAGEGFWQWQDGGVVDLASELWANDEPSGSEGENCMEMLRDGHWNDVVCDLPLPYVCEAPAP